MKPTPIETRCPPLGVLRRLLQPGLPEAEAKPLRDHLSTCLSCRQLWLGLQTETVVNPTPPVLHSAGETNPPFPPSKMGGEEGAQADGSAIVRSSEIALEGDAGQRAGSVSGGMSTFDASGSLAAPPSRAFPFLSPPKEAGELGWLAHYSIRGVLGEGGMGFVFDAFDTQLHRRVALKVLKPELAANTSFRERFLLEARAAAALPDEYIITIYRVGLENNVPFLTMKFLYGESLEQRLVRDVRLPYLEILRIGREIALGLSAAHDRGLIHRDIKPANLWLETPPPEPGNAQRTRLSIEHLYRVKILDFGLARPIHDSRRLTAAGLIVGTPQYLAPEQARGQKLDHRCDLFSLGVVLYRMATGALPFDGSDTLAQLTALATTEPRPIEELAPDIPEGLRQLIHRLLERDPAKRPQTARVVAEALRSLEKDELRTAPVLEEQSPKRARGPSSSERRRWVMAGGLLGLLMARDSTKQDEGQAGSVSPVFAPQQGADAPRSTRWLLAGVLLGLLFVGGLVLWRSLRPAGGEKAAAVPGREVIKVGVLFSLRGPMSIAGSAAHDAVQLAIDELNKQGGLLGRRVEAIHEDGESNYRKFAAAAEKLISEDRVRVIFGTRASVHRKSVKEVVEKHDHLLFYPMQFEGLEESPNIIYLGAAPNQQMFPAVDFFLGKQGKRRLFLVGSDYVFPHAANAILRDYVKIKYPDAQVLDEKYVSFGSTKVQEAIRAIEEKKPDLVVNTINGDPNVAFFREFYQAGLRADTTPVLSFCIGEGDLLAIGEASAGHYAAWSYFQSIDRPENREFVRKFRGQFGSRRAVSDPMETIYFGIHLWAQAVQAAGSAEPRAVREAIKGRLFEAPEGAVRIDRDTRYTWRAMRIGRVRPDGQFEIVFDTEWAIRPEPFPIRPRAAWEQFLNDLYTGWGNRWLAGDKMP